MDAIIKGFKGTNCMTFFNIPVYFLLQFINGVWLTLHYSLPIDYCSALLIYIFILLSDFTLTEFWMYGN